MSTCEPLPKGRPQHLVGTSELSTSFLDSFRGLWKPVARSIPTLQRSDCVVPSFQLEKPFMQKLGSEDDNDKIHISSSRGIDGNRISSNCTGKKVEPSRKTTKASRRGSTTRILLNLCHQNIDLSELLHEENGTELSSSALSSISLDTLIHCARRISVREADYYFKQIVSGVEYLHDAGIAHRDLNLENLILTSEGTVKITSFRHTKCFLQLGGNKSKIRTSSNKCGSLPYLAPEVLVEQHFDPRPVDMWALAIIYMEMRTGKLLWNFAAEGGDEYYDRYLRDRKGLWGYRPVENLENENCRDTVRVLLEPRPKKRPSAAQVLEFPWMRSIEI